MIPGLGSDARAYVPLAAHLAGRFRCILYDLPTGKGDGARMRSHDLDALRADVLALLDHLGQRTGTAIGWSFGSMIALHTMATAPDRIDHAVLLGGFARRPLARAEVLLARLLRHWHAPMGHIPFHDRLLFRSHHEPFAEQPPEVWQFFLQRCGAASVAAVAHRALLLHATDLRPELSRIRGPVLLVTGECDPLVPHELTRELRDHLPGAVHVKLAGCGHFAALSHTAVLADVIRGFLLPRPAGCDGGNSRGATTVLPATC
jgi:pimeloyl-ACP methyl ester carboxylesterase